MKPTYSEGSVFLVPLRAGGYARGLVARTAPQGRVLLGYFFGPRLESAPSAVPADLDPANAILRVRFGDLGLINGEWPIVGHVPKWNRTQWPMPDFVRRDPLGKMKARIVRYSDDDPNRIEEEHTVDDGLGLEADSLHGYGAIEIRLTNLTETRK
jgi:hypothetical protein